MEYIPSVVHLGQGVSPISLSHQLIVLQHMQDLPDPSRLVGLVACKAVPWRLPT